ncbi:hypothetical protein [Streptomyces sp. DSM 41534]
MSVGDAAAVGLGPYMDAVAGNCPYLTPATRTGQTRWMRYRPAPGSDLEIIASKVFAVAVEAAEDVRTRRAAGARLACAVIAVELAPHLGQRALAWPHWALKTAYGPVGVVAGKFWPEQTATDRRGRPVVPPPLPLLAVRAAVPVVDARLLSRTPRLATVVGQAQDDGRDVFAVAGGLSGDLDVTWSRVRSWAAHQLEGEVLHDG